MNTAREMFDLSLPDLGPYAIDFTKNGRFLLLGGRKGHLALMDTLRMDVQMEVWIFHESYVLCELQPHMLHFCWYRCDCFLWFASRQLCGAQLAQKMSTS